MSIVGLLLLLAAGCAAVPAQTVAVVGTVVDAGGGAIERASVVLEGSGGQYKAATVRTGEFGFPAVAPGTYTLTIEAHAFIDKTIPNIRATPGESLDLKTIALKIAGCFAPGVMCDNFGMGPPLLHAEASVEVPFDCGVDADGGGVRCKTFDSSIDFRVQGGSNGEIYLSPAKGASLALDTRGEWTKSDCVNASYAASQLRVDQLKGNYRVCVHTNNGRYAEVYGFYKSPDDGTVHMTFETW